MSLTAGRGPFGPRRAGWFDGDVPDRIVYVEPVPRRVRGVLGGVTVVDSEGAVLIHETGVMPHYAFPRVDVTVDGGGVPVVIDEPRAAGFVQVAWDAVDAWFEEDERVHVHPRNPYHRIDCFATSRRITVSAAGEALADSARSVALYETGLPTRYYLPTDDVRMELLVASETVTRCAYKGAALHWSASVAGAVIDDVAWEYRSGVEREAEPIQGRLSFYPSRVEVRVDGQLQTPE